MTCGLEKILEKRLGQGQVTLHLADINYADAL